MRESLSALIAGLNYPNFCLFLYLFIYARKSRIYYLLLWKGFVELHLRPLSFRLLTCSGQDMYNCYIIESILTPKFEVYNNLGAEIESYIVSLVKGRLR